MSDADTAADAMLHYLAREGAPIHVDKLCAELRLLCKAVPEMRGLASVDWRLEVDAMAESGYVCHVGDRVQIVRGVERPQDVPQGMLF